MTQSTNKWLTLNNFIKIKLNLNTGPSWCYCGDAGNIIQVYEMILNSNPNAGGRINTNASYPLRLGKMQHFVKNVPKPHINSV